MSGEDGALGEIRRALAGITRRLDALADAVGVAAAAQPGALLDEPTRARLVALGSLLAIGRATTLSEAGPLAVDRVITHARADCAAILRLSGDGALATIVQRGFRFPLEPHQDEGIPGRSLRTGEVVQAAPGMGAPDGLLGWAGWVDPQTLESHGIDAIIEKPVGLDALRATVATLVERASAAPE